jgi:hypothetical protein
MAMSASAEWNPYARCEINLTLLLRASSRPLERLVECA